MNKDFIWHSNRPIFGPTFPLSIFPKSTWTRWRTKPSRHWHPCKSSKEAQSQTPTKVEWSDTTGSDLGTGSERGDQQGDPGDKRKNQEPREASPSRRVAGSGGPVYRSSGHWNRRFGPRSPICGKSLGASKPRQARRPFLRQHRSRRDRPDLPKSGRGFPRPLPSSFPNRAVPPRRGTECWRPKTRFRPMDWISPNKRLRLPEKAAGCTNTPPGMVGWISSRCGIG